MLLSIAKIRCWIKIATYTNKAKIGIVKLKISKSLSIHIVIQLSRHILLSKSQFVKLNIVSDKDDRNYKLSSFFIHRKELLKCIGYEVLLKN